MTEDHRPPPAANDSEPVMQAKCPICGRPAEVRYRPFCSKRCADVDLSRWLNGVYAVPVTGEEDEDADGPHG